MTQRLVRAERNEFGELWAKMIAAHDNRSQIEHSAASRRTSRSEGTERRRRIKRAQRLGGKALYGKAAKALAQSPTFDPAAPGMYAKMKALHSPPAAGDQVAPIPPATCRLGHTSPQTPSAPPCTPWKRTQPRVQTGLVSAGSSLSQTQSSGFTLTSLVWRFSPP